MEIWCIFPFAVSPLNIFQFHLSSYEKEATQNYPFFVLKCQHVGHLI